MINRLYLFLPFMVVLLTDATANEPGDLPNDVPPVLGMGQLAGDSEKWRVQVHVPKVAWEWIGEKRPKIEWPHLKVHVEEVVLDLAMSYPSASQLSEDSQNRIVDLKGNRLNRDEVAKRLKQKTPLLISISGRMPDPYYLQCTKPDTLLLLLGLPDAPAVDLLPRAHGTATPPSAARAREGGKK